MTDTQVLVHADLGGTPVPAGRLWARQGALRLSEVEGGPFLSTAEASRNLTVPGVFHELAKEPYSGGVRSGLSPRLGPSRLLQPVKCLDVSGARSLNQHDG